jgi:hypothetical protein
MYTTVTLKLNEILFLKKGTLQGKNSFVCHKKYVPLL